MICLFHRIYEISQTFGKPRKTQRIVESNFCVWRNGKKVSQLLKMSKKCSSRRISFKNISLDTAENESCKVCYRSFTHHNYTSCIPYLHPSVARATRSSVASPPPWLLQKHRQAVPVQSGVRFLQNIGRTESHTKKGRWRLRFCF